VPRLIEQLDVVLGRQVGREQLHSAQVDLAPADPVQEDRIGPRGPRGLDPVIGARLREVQDLGAVAEHRGAALVEVEGARLDLGEVGEQIRLDLVVPGDERVERAEQFAIGNGLERGGAWRAKAGSGHGVPLDGNGGRMGGTERSMRREKCETEFESSTCETARGGVRERA
jgi:hypothetical protein